MRIAKKYKAFEQKLARFRYQVTTIYVDNGTMKGIHYKEPDSNDKFIVELIDNMDHVLLYHSKEFRKQFRNRIKKK